jgi:kynurenine formamidase
MSRRLIMTFVVLFSCFLMVSVAAADKYMPETSKWGPDDEIGNANYLAPEKVLEATSLVKEGKVFDLGQVYSIGLPAYPPRTYKSWLLVHQMMNPVGKNRATFMEEYVAMSCGIATQLDGFAHGGCNGVFYNGVKKEDIIDPKGAKKFGMEKVPPFVTRGVMVDMVAYKGRNLAGGEVITLKDLKGALKKAGVELRPGDAPIIHTGWMQLWDVDNEKMLKSVPGIGEDVAWYLVEKGILGVGTDQFTTEVMPMADKDTFFPCHTILLGNGIHLFQNLVTEELAKACAKDGKNEFLFIFTHPKLKGTVQGIGQPIAVK